MPAEAPRYRLNVAAILRNPEGRILICERLGNPGAWQFPQGGVDAGESLEEALAREIEEEIGVTRDLCRPIAQAGPFRYEFGDGRKVKGFHGKDQHFFLVHFSGSPEAIRVDLPNPEFQAYRWIFPGDFSLAWLPSMKREMYARAFRSLLKIELE
ncbi:MAG: hypothetical protein RLZZ399_1453 [Verrucomicrobiota bacterium]|jgi:putative (di)nucleoside polyphosphate hydrolase